MATTPKLLVISINNIGHGLSGGDRIWVNFVKRWQRHLDIFLLGVPESINLLKRHQCQLKNILIDTENNHEYLNLFPLIIHQIRRVFKAKIYVLRHLSEFSQYTHLLSVSDFYPDFLTAFIIKIFYPKIIWIASFYLSAPNPLSKNSPYLQNHQQLKGWLYFLSQIPVLFIINHFANIILVTSEPDIKKFPKKKVIVVRGGVESVNYQHFLDSSEYILPHKRKYLGCYLGRLHVQKGILKLVDIWKLVVKKMPQAKLAIIGNGQLENILISKIKKLHLEKNIDLYGFQDGQSKIKIFQNSQIILHPATFDSGGMAAAEGLSWGLPGISFDLESLKSYYPQGFIKIPCFNNQKFADSIIKLSQDKILYQKLSQNGLKLISDSWTWDKQSQSVYRQLFYDQ